MDHAFGVIGTALSKHISVFESSSKSGPDNSKRIVEAHARASSHQRQSFKTRLYFKFSRQGGRYYLPLLSVGSGSLAHSSLNLARPIKTSSALLKLVHLRTYGTVRPYRYRVDLARHAPTAVLQYSSTKFRVLNLAYIVHNICTECTHTSQTHDHPATEVCTAVLNLVEYKLLGNPNQLSWVPEAAGFERL
jgi:hypothetical protein